MTLSEADKNKIVVVLANTKGSGLSHLYWINHITKGARIIRPWRNQIFGLLKRAGENQLAYKFDAYMDQKGKGKAVGARKKGGALSLAGSGKKPVRKTLPVRSAKPKRKPAGGKQRGSALRLAGQGMNNSLVQMRM